MGKKMTVATLENMRRLVLRRAALTDNWSAGCQRILSDKKIQEVKLIKEVEPTKFIVD